VPVLARDYSCSAKMVGKFIDHSQPFLQGTKSIWTNYFPNGKFIAVCKIYSRWNQNFGRSVTSFFVWSIACARVLPYLRQSVGVLNFSTFGGLTVYRLGLLTLLFSTSTHTMATLQKIKIAARLRPLIQGEIDDGSVKVIHPSDNTKGSSHSTSSSQSFISVANPRDPNQVFKFP